MDFNMTRIYTNFNASLKLLLLEKLALLKSMTKDSVSFSLIEEKQTIPRFSSIEVKLLKPVTPKENHFYLCMLIFHTFDNNHEFKMFAAMCDKNIKARVAMDEVQQFRHANAIITGKELKVKSRGMEITAFLAMLDNFFYTFDKSQTIYDDLANKPNKLSINKEVEFDMFILNCINNNYTRQEYEEKVQEIINWGVKGVDNKYIVAMLLIYSALCRGHNLMFTPNTTIENGALLF